MKHIETALHRLKHTKPDRESSVLLRVLKMNDAKTATNLALDMFLVGIDTVCLFNYFIVIVMQDM